MSTSASRNHCTKNNKLDANSPALFNIKNNIYPIGVKIDVEDIKTLLLEAEVRGLITTSERLSICGYRILRGNRRGNELTTFSVYNYRLNKRDARLS